MPGEPRDARFVEIDGVRVRYLDTAQAEPSRGAASSWEGPTVVLLHGFASAIEAWAPVLPALSSRHRVLALDLKGFGWTDRPEGDYSPDAQARIVLGLLDRRGVGEAALVAHSWGSSVALAAALAASRRVTKLALVSPWVYEDQLPPFFHWARTEGVGEMMFGLYYKAGAAQRVSLAFYDKAHVTDVLLAEVTRGLDRPGTVAAALAAVRGQRFARMESRYRTLDKPALVLLGRDDEVSPPSFGERLARDLPNAKLVVYPRCGHFPMVEANEAACRDLLSFLSPEVST